MRRYAITHTTTYSYDDDVTDSYGLAYTQPQDGQGQRLLEHALDTDPGPGDQGAHRDSAGNVATFFHLTEPHRRLVVTARSLVEVNPGERDPATDLVRWQDARPLWRPDLPEAALAAEYCAQSPLVDLVAGATAYARESFPQDGGLVDGVLDLVSRLHADFAYEPGSTTVTTRVADVLHERRGVCQDFAHLALAGLRGLGLSARYVSGYLATDPPPGRPRLVGADATHAWLEVWIPGHPWLAVDPTNDCEIGDRHVVVARGRDYADVPPVKGVIFTEATESTMAVSVDVLPLA